MPKFDGTGPVGKGPMTGRGGGYCIIPLNTTEQEIEYLRNQERALKKQLECVEERIRNIKDKDSRKEVSR